MTPKVSSSQQWTLHSAFSRAHTVLREEGIKSLWFKILGETVYRRVILAQRLLSEPIPKCTARLPIAVGLLKEVEIDEYLHLRPDTDRRTVQQRLATGHLCFVVRHQNRLVSAAWVAIQRVWIDYLACEIELAPDEVYPYESFTAADIRGQDIALARSAHMLQHLASAGYRRVVVTIMPENTPSLRQAEKAGCHLFGTMGYVKLGGWRRDFCRVKEGTRPPGLPPRQPQTISWDHVAQSFRQKPHYLDAFLGEMKKQTYLSLVERWGGLPERGHVLKTDLFEEAMGADALLEDLLSEQGITVGMDIALTIARRARRQNGRKPLSYVTTDVRHLPFASNSFALIISPSTLDHFPDSKDLGASLRELGRILAPEGRLIITLDNRQNVFDPLLRLANTLKLTPYYLGRSYRIDELCNELEATGFTVEEKTAILHNPRLVAVTLVKLADALRWSPFTRLVRNGLIVAQRLEHTRWCYFTGSFIAAKAVRKYGSQ